MQRLNTDLDDYWTKKPAEEPEAAPEAAEEAPAPEATEA